MNIEIRKVKERYWWPHPIHREARGGGITAFIRFYLAPTWL